MSAPIIANLLRECPCGAAVFLTLIGYRAWPLPRRELYAGSCWRCGPLLVAVVPKVRI